jgi:hypothetical protein
VVAPRQGGVPRRALRARRPLLGDRVPLRTRQPEQGGLKVIKKISAAPQIAGRKLKVRNIDDKQVSNEDLKVIHHFAILIFV